LKKNDAVMCRQSAKSSAVFIYPAASIPRVVLIKKKGYAAGKIKDIHTRWLTDISCTIRGGFEVSSQL
jgi:hypothetical protein